MPAVSSEDHERPVVVETPAIEGHAGPVAPAGYEEAFAETPPTAHKPRKHSRASARATAPKPRPEHEHEHEHENEHENKHENHESESGEEETLERTPTADMVTVSPIADDAAVLADDLAKVEAGYATGERVEHEKHARGRQKVNPVAKPRTGKKKTGRTQDELETEYLPDEDVQTL